jgi:hypothetical protein
VGSASLRCLDTVHVCFARLTVQKCRNMLHSASAVHAAPRLVACLLEPSLPPLQTASSRHPRAANRRPEQAVTVTGLAPFRPPRNPRNPTSALPTDWASRCGGWCSGCQQFSGQLAAGSLQCDRRTAPSHPGYRAASPVPACRRRHAIPRQHHHRLPARRPAGTGRGHGRPGAGVSSVPAIAPAFLPQH